MSSERDDTNYRQILFGDPSQLPTLSDDHVPACEPDAVAAALDAVRADLRGRRAQPSAEHVTRPRDAGAADLDPDVVLAEAARGLARRRARRGDFVATLACEDIARAIEGPTGDNNGPETGALESFAAFLHTLHDDPQETNGQVRSCREHRPHHT